MKDKKIENLMENLSDIDKLDLDIDEIWSEADLDESDIDKIKEKTYGKIGKSKIRKYSNNKIISLVASLVLVIVIGSTGVMAIVGKMYKYDTSSGKILKSELPIYILEKPITKKAYNGKITLKSFVVDTEQEEVVLEVYGYNLDGYEYMKHEIKINGKDIFESDYEQIDKTEGIGNDWSTSLGRPYEYKEGDQYVYSTIFKDKDNKITSVDFPVELTKATSVEEYNKNLPNDTKNNVTISSITREENDTLYIDLLAIPNQRNMDFEVDSYGNYTVVNNRTGIFLTDANGKRVEVEPLVEDESSTKFKVNVSNLKKPYTLEVNQVNVSARDLKMKNVKLPKLKVNERKWIDMVVDIEDKNNALTKGSSKVLIKSVKRIKDEGEDSYSMNIHYPDNDNSPIKLRCLNFETKTFLIPFVTNNLMTTASQMSSSMEGDIFSDTTVYLGRSNKKYRSATFKISGEEYFIEGPWKLIIK